MIACSPQETYRSALTITSVGVGQSIHTFDDKVAFLGDDAGVGTVDIRNAADLGSSTFVGTFTVNGVSRLAHPVGLARMDGYPTFVGGESNKIMQFNWDQFLIDGNLDTAFVSLITDDRGQDNYTRTTYAKADGTVYVVATDYQVPEGETNLLRVYDPTALAAATATSEAGVQLYELPTFTFVQSMAWLEDTHELVLVRNETLFHGWRLTYIDLAAAINAGDSREAVTRERRFPYDTELEGWNRTSLGDDVFIIGDPDIPNVYVK